MSDISKEKVDILSQLCRIQLSEAESAEIFRDLDQVLDYVNQLREVSTDDLIPYNHFDAQGIDSLHEDKIGQHLSHEEFLNNAPEKVGGRIRIPPVIR
ncbi:MAG: Asp-tRNA(Asn)/Glu-tRNA(Gln) amidotransferase subunit GatC [Chlamydiales bacterium]